MKVLINLIFAIVKKNRKMADPKPTKRQIAHSY